jgi:hypothetical protein
MSLSRARRNDMECYEDERAADERGAQRLLLISGCRAEIRVVLTVSYFLRRTTYFFTFSQVNLTLDMVALSYVKIVTIKDSNYF